MALITDKMLSFSLYKLEWIMYTLVTQKVFMLPHVRNWSNYRKIIDDVYQVEILLISLFFSAQTTQQQFIQYELDIWIYTYRVFI